MKYQLIRWQQNGSVIVNEDGTSTQPIMVWTGIVGDTYGFQKTDPTNIIFSNSLTVPEIAIALQQGAEKFVSEKYPNT